MKCANSGQFSDITGVKQLATSNALHNGSLYIMCVIFKTRKLQLAVKLFHHVDMTPSETGKVKAADSAGVNLEQCTDSEKLAGTSQNLYRTHMPKLN